MRPTVLFVDDDHRVLESFQRQLRPHRDAWASRYASCADEALDALAQSSIDVVVSDIAMPKKDGLQLLSEAQSDERTKAIPFIIVTGNHEGGLKRKALDLGAADLLSKPVDTDDLVARIRSALRLKAYQDRLACYNAQLEAMVTERTQQLAASRLEVIWRLGKAAEFRDEDTGHHVIRVGYICGSVAKALGMDADFVERITLASPLHDIGKIGIPDQILLKRGPLTAEERLIMQKHCEIGQRILCGGITPLPSLTSCGTAVFDTPAIPNDILGIAGRIALAHHERWDGTGYPYGLQATAIPLEARITAMADVYDALASNRPYKPAFSESRCLQILRKGCGSHFDPAVYDAFERSLDAVRTIQAEYGSQVSCNGDKNGLERAA